MLDLESTDQGTVLPVKVHARARRNGIDGIRDRILRIAVTAAPEKGKANQAVIEVLSRALGVSKSSIEVISGETSTRKRLLISGVTADAVRSALEPLAGPSDD
jgi:uncharacterized protein